MVLAAILLTSIGILGIAGLGDRTPGGVPTVAPAPGGGSDEQGLPDPFAWDPEREDEFVARAAKGTSHLLYTLSPGGVAESAQRVGRWRRQIEAAAKVADVDPDTLEGLVFLESAGRDDAITPNGIEGAVGLTQILAGTATDLLGMKVDTPRSAQLGRRIDRERARGHEDKVRSAARRAGEGRRALRRRQGARGDRALPQARQGHARPRGLRVRLLPHGDRQPAGRAAGVRLRARAGPRSTSTPASPATRRPTAGCSSSATTPPTTTGRCSRGGRSCACTATTARSSSA